MATSNFVNLSNFPTLKIDPVDVYGSWKKFLNQFTLQLRFQVLSAGKKKVNDQEVDAFGDEQKCLALLHSIGIEGQEILLAQGYDFTTDSKTYDATVGLLKNHYGREESLNVRLRNFFYATQLSDENSRDYLRRVERLSRSIELFKNDNADANTALDAARAKITEVTVVNGLRNVSLRRELMAKKGLTWDKLSDILTSRDAASESSAKLENPKVVLKPVIKTEVAYASSYQGERVSRQPSRDSSYDRNRSSSYERYRRWRKYEQEQNNQTKSSSGKDYKQPESTYKRSQSPSYGSKSLKGDNRCYACGSKEHHIRNCKQAICHYCGNKGHVVLDCPKKSKGGPVDPRRSPPKKSPSSVSYVDTEWDPSNAPKSLRSRTPSPYPNKGRNDSPDSFIRAVSKIQMPSTYGYDSD